MVKSKKVVPKRGPGRPATGRDPVTAIRLDHDVRVRLDEWAKENGLNSRSEAIRQLVEQGLSAGKVVDEPNPVAQPAKPARRRM